MGVAAQQLMAHFGQRGTRMNRNPFILTLCALVIPLAPRSWSQAPEREPTAEQIAVAVEAYAKVGATYRAIYYWRTKQTAHTFRLPRDTADADLDRLIDLPFAFALDLGCSEVTDAAIGKLKKLKHMTELRLWGNKITDAGLEELKTFKQLTYLNLWAVAATESVVDDLQEVLPNCHIVYIANTNAVTPEPPPFEPIPEQLVIADKAFARLGATHSLHTDNWTGKTTRLYKMPRKTTDADLKNVPNLPFRFGLDLECTPVTDAGLKQLREFRSLTRLVLNGTRITDAGLGELTNLKNLAALDLDRTRVTDAGLRRLKVLRKLSRLSLANSKITGVGLTRLKELSNLTYLNLANTRVTDDWLNEISDLGLFELNLAGTLVTNDGVKEAQGFLRGCKIWR